MIRVEIWATLHSLDRPGDWELRVGLGRGGEENPWPAHGPLPHEPHSVPKPVPFPLTSDPTCSWLGKVRRSHCLSVGLGRCMVGRWPMADGRGKRRLYISHRLSLRLKHSHPSPSSTLGTRDSTRLVRTEYPPLSPSYSFQSHRAQGRRRCRLTCELDTGSSLESRAIDSG